MQTVVEVNVFKANSVDQAEAYLSKTLQVMFTVLEGKR